MEYSLAKELKDNGFPHKYGRYEYVDGNIMTWVESKPDEINPNHVYIPTLSELIEACGAQYIEKEKTFEFVLSYSLDGWYAQYTDENDILPKLENGYGPTPEEAVARLWLTLNQKSETNP